MASTTSVAGCNLRMLKYLTLTSNLTTDGRQVGIPREQDFSNFGPRPRPRLEHRSKLVSESANSTFRFQHLGLQIWRFNKTGTKLMISSTIQGNDLKTSVFVKYELIYN